MLKVISFFVLCYLSVCPVFADESTQPFFTLALDDAEKSFLHLIRDKKGNYLGNEILPAEIAFKITESNLILDFKAMLDGVIETNQERDASYWENQSLEIFIAPPGKPEEYRHYVIAPSGGFYDALKMDSKWNGKIKFKTAATANMWSVEICIPSEDLGLNIFSSGMKLPVNFAWNMGDSGRTVYWSPAPKGLHDITKFGSIFLKQKVFACFDIKSAGQSILNKQIPAVFSVRSNEIPTFIRNLESRQQQLSDKIQNVKLNLPVQFELSNKNGMVLAKTPWIIFKPTDLVLLTTITPYVYEGLDGIVEISLLPTMDMQKASVRWTMTDKCGNLILEGKLDKLSHNNTLILPMKKLLPDDYVFMIDAKINNKLFSRKTIIHKPESAISFTYEKLVKVGNDKPFFPIGMWMPWPNIENESVPELFSPLQIAKDLPEIVDFGFNCVMIPEAKHSLADKAYDTAEKLGLYVLYMGQNPKERFEKYRNIFAWAMYDEPSGFEDLTPGFLRTSYKSEKSKYPYMPVLVNHMKVKALRDYSGSRDIIAMDPYAFGRDVSLKHIPEYVRAMKRYCKGIMPCWVVLQFFKMNDVYYLPTLEQMRCQTYLTLLMGADGIFYFTTATPESPACHLLTDPKLRPLWKSMKNLLKDVNADLPIFKSTVIEESCVGDMSELHGIYWKIYDVKNTGKVLVLVNTKSCPTRLISGKKELRQFKISGDIPAYAVKIMKVNHK